MKRHRLNWLFFSSVILWLCARVLAQEETVHWDPMVDPYLETIGSMYAAMVFSVVVGLIVGFARFPSAFVAPYDRASLLQLSQSN